jgi:hypothetical protein
MQHVVQAGLFNEFGFKGLLDALDANDSKYTIVSVREHLQPEVDFDPDEDVMVWGSMGLARIATERGWKPGAFQGPEFDMQQHGVRFGRNFFNHDATYCKFSEMDFTEPMFVRPVHDTKVFNGGLMTPEDMVPWRDRIVELAKTGYCSITGDTPVMFAPPKPIDHEARFFVVDGRVVTGSVYRSFGEVMYARIDSTNAFFYPMMQFAQRMAELGETPISATYVLDVSITGDECSVLEVNSTASAGFYKCDMNSVVRALEGMINSWRQERLARAEVLPPLDNDF